MTIILMQKRIAQTEKMLLATESELFNKLIESSHPFKQLDRLINFTELVEPLRRFYSSWGEQEWILKKGLNV